MKPVLLDSGVLVALLDRSEGLHKECVNIVQGLEAPLVTCEAVIAESCYLLRGIRGASEAVMRNVREGLIHIPFQIAEHAIALEATLRKYHDREIDLADACLIVLAGMYETGEILTLDSDFQIYRWGRNGRFHLLPASPKPE